VAIVSLGQGKACSVMFGDDEVKHDEFFNSISAGLELKVVSRHDRGAERRSHGHLRDTELATEEEAPQDDLERQQRFAVYCQPTVSVISSAVIQLGPKRLRLFRAAILQSQPDSKNLRADFGIAVPNRRFGFGSGQMHWMRRASDCIVAFK
jgi:hypothetical protein